MRMLPADREPTPPGEMLREEFMKPLGLTQAELAAKLGMPRVAVNAIINGKRHAWDRDAPCQGPRHHTRVLDQRPDRRRPVQGRTRRRADSRGSEDNAHHRPA
jgi:hypothetical protein